METTAGPIRRALPAALAALALLAGACSGDESAGGGEETAGSRLTLVVDDSGVAVTEDGTEVLVPSGAGGGDAPVAWRTIEPVVETKGGVYLGHELLSAPSDEAVPWTAAADPGTPVEGTGVEAVLPAVAGEGEATVAIEEAGDRVARVTVRAPEGANEVAVSFACAADERFYGFGAQTWATQHRGQTIPLWVVEQGLGKKTPDTPEPAPSLLGEPYDSYIPMPWFFSSAGYGISLDTTRFSTVELCTPEHPDTWRVRSWSNELSWYVLTGDEPLELVERYTGVVGRPERPPPDWFYAPMNDAVRGRENVERVAALLRDNDIPSSVIWTEDWIGLGSAATGLRLSHDWDVSPQDYPDLKDMTDGLHEAGFRFLGYFSPFLPDAAATPGGEGTLPSGETVTLHPQNDRKWPEALEGGFAFTDPAGEPYNMLSPPFVPPGGSALDVTNPEAIEWFQGWVAEAEALGLDGSMTDFGEWVPFDARFADGRTGAEVHNEYPVRWQEANREVWEQLRPDGDYLFYVRSGFTGTQRAAPAVWGGDQNTTFDRLDGLGSVATMGVNLGLSGIAFFGHDIAGYSAFAIPGVENTPTTEELFLRWAAIGAWTPMMRTHHGSRYGENWSFEGAPNPEDPVRPVPDPATLAAWKRLATEHIRLFPYLSAYGAQAVERGLPIMRHPVLLYPEDPVIAGGIPDDPAFAAFDAVSLPERELFQYFLGDELLVAPIIDAGVDERPVYLPEGGWVDIRSGQRHEGPTVVTATAAPGEISVYARAGAIVPRLPEGVETLVPTDDPGVVDHTDVADELVLDVYLGAGGRFVLADGTTFELAGDAVGAGPLSVAIGDERLEVDETGGVATVVTPPFGDGDVTIALGGEEALLSVRDAPSERALTLRIHR